MYNSDYDIHNATFVDHLNHSPKWFLVIQIGLIKRQVINGIIHTTRSYNKGPIKCKDYQAFVDITNRWDL